MPIQRWVDFSVGTFLFAGDNTVTGVLTVAGNVVVGAGGTIVVTGLDDITTMGADDVTF